MFILPKLKYDYDALEPHIDAQTMEIHHKKHHAGYIKKLNQALVDSDVNVERIETLFESITEYTDSVRNNAGGHYNHSLFWSILSDSMSLPSDNLSKAISSSFGLLEDLKTEFLKQSIKVFGSGWCWLVLTKKGELKIVTTKNQDTPLMSDIDAGYPLFGVDVWEHAYYLKYQNNRIDYLHAVWSQLNWFEISRRYESKPEMNDVNTD